MAGRDSGPHFGTFNVCFPTASPRVLPTRNYSAGSRLIAMRGPSPHSWLGMGRWC